MSLLQILCCVKGHGIIPSFSFVRQNAEVLSDDTSQFNRVTAGSTPILVAEASKSTTKSLVPSRSVICLISS